MGVHTGAYVVYYLYRSRYAFVADHCLKDGHHMVDLSDLKHALKFPNEAQARRFIADDLDRPESGPYFVSSCRSANCWNTTRSCMRYGALHGTEVLHEHIKAAAIPYFADKGSFRKGKVPQQ